MLGRASGSTGCSIGLGVNYTRNIVRLGSQRRARASSGSGRGSMMGLLGRVLGTEGGAAYA